MAAKLADKGPTRKEENAKLLEEEEKIMAKPQKIKKNGWGKKI